ncbi:hypothetical protein GCM10027191_17010 [Novilysobacter erysipheiresistens]
MLLKFSIRRSVDQLPSARTVNCWIRADGSDTRRAGPLAQATSSSAHDAIAAQRVQLAQRVLVIV